MRKSCISRNVCLSISLYKKHFKILPKIIWIIDRIIFATDIPFKADIDPTVRWGHNGLGTVVNPNSKIGEHTLIMQGVTIAGSLEAEREYNGQIICSPIIGKHCMIGANSSLIGPIVIGDNVIIGAGAVVTKDIPDNSLVVGVPGRVIREVTDKELSAY